MSGAVRNSQCVGVGRPSLYDLSLQRQIFSQSSDHREHRPAIASNSSALIPLPSVPTPGEHPFFPKLEHQVDYSVIPSLSPLDAGSPEPNSADLYTTHYPPHIRATNHIVEYPAACPEPVLRSPHEATDRFFDYPHRQAHEIHPGSHADPVNSLMFPCDGTLYEASTTINGGTFVSGNVKNIQCHGEIGIHMLHHTAVLEAIHDSVDSFPQPRCHPDTRKEMLQKLWNWSTNSESLVDSDSEAEVLTEKSTPILWVYGPLGAGKSAIMQTLSRRLQAAGRLGGSFFFKRGHATRGNAKALFATLAYQIALNIPQFKVPISHIVEDDPSVVGRSMDNQMQKLIVEPCQSLDNSRCPIIIIDGLDNCEGENIQREILGIIGNSIREHSPPLRIIIASRPEPHIREPLEASLFHGLHRSFNVEQSFEDVETYLRNELARIRDEHHETMSTIPNPWPSEEVIHHLVYKSSGYFIYATTVIKFVDDKNFRPTERLAAVESLGGSEFESPFGTLDELYTQILATAPAHSCLLAILRSSPVFICAPAT
ncbi:hypothetical protein B0H10DRAFT_1926221 [Mycena sp. CBHHK59/15]|nr:hypothetical protein B0H10DRAFT_1926221 [Mycena sp. CBHHK59/15]